MSLSEPEPSATEERSAARTDGTHGPREPKLATCQPSANQVELAPGSGRSRVFAGCGQSSDREAGVVSRDTQETIDDLAFRLGRPTAVDDSRFRLQVYSPQMGPLDDVRITSILFRDSPQDAKRWVLSHGIADATAPVRLPGAPDLGLLPRICVPIRNDGTLLGYLWVIDADGSATEAELALCNDVAGELAPLLFRIQALSLLDRETERRALAALVGDDSGGRASAAETLHRSGVLATGMRPIAVVAAVADPGPGGLTDTAAVALEVGIERTRRLVSDPHVAQFRADDRAVILVGADDREVVRHGVTWIATRIHELLAGQLPTHRVVVGVGRPQRSLVDTVVSFREARDAARVLLRLASLGDVSDVDSLRLFRPMLYVPEEVLATSIPAGLVDLLAREDARELAQTLECFLDRAGDAAGTAEVLGVHRATVYKRLARAALLDIDLDVGADRRALHHAFAVARFLGRWPPAG